MDFAAARQKMVDNQLRTSNVTDHRLLTAMGEVSREIFLPPENAALAYADVLHRFAGGRFLPPPTPFARLVQLAEIIHTDCILDVGAASGYTSAVLARLGSEVVALEADASLAETARANLAGVANVSVVTGSFDGAGQPGGHFDVVILEGAVVGEPVALFRLLREGGRLVALVANAGPAVAHVYVRSGDEVAGRSEFNSSLPALAAAPRAEDFVF